MVITTHMIHQMTRENNENILKNPDSEIIESFLENSPEIDENQKVIASHS